MWHFYAHVCTNALNGGFTGHTSYCDGCVAIVFVFSSTASNCFAAMFIKGSQSNALKNLFTLEELFL